MVIIFIFLNWWGISQLENQNDLFLYFLTYSLFILTYDE